MIIGLLGAEDRRAQSLPEFGLCGRLFVIPATR
jgi:hypothetical protein